MSSFRSATDAIVDVALRSEQQRVGSIGSDLAALGLREYARSSFKMRITCVRSLHLVVIAVRVSRITDLVTLRVTLLIVARTTVVTAEVRSNTREDHRVAVAAINITAIVAGWKVYGLSIPHEFIVVQNLTCDILLDYECLL